jgi:hypothetical protein
MKLNLPPKIDGFLSCTPFFNVHVHFFAGFFLISPYIWPNSGFRCCVCLTLQITLLSTKDFEFESLIQYGDLELVYLFQQLTSITTNVMLYMICCFLATINHICMTKFHRFPSYKLLWYTQLGACNSLFFRKLCLNSS